MIQKSDPPKITEAADILGVNRATLANWLHGGRIPALQCSPRGIYRGRYGDVIEFMEASRLRPFENNRDRI